MASPLISAKRDGNRRVLVVDDDREFAEGVQVLLVTKGYEVEVVRSAAVAIHAARDFGAEVALIDIRLGGSSGFNLIRDLQQQLPDLLCVVVTASASAATAIEALQAGAYDYLQKPFHSSDLLAILDRSFERLLLAHQKAKAEESLWARNRQLELVNRRLRGVVDGMRRLATCATLDELYLRILEEVARVIGAHGGSIYLKEADWLVLHHALDPGHASDTISLPLDENTVFERALKTGRPVLVPDPETDTDVMPSGWSGYRDQSLLAFPLSVDGDRLMGVLSLHAKDNAPFTPQDRELGHILISFGCETIRVVQALENLARSEELFGKIVENSPSAIFLKDLEGRYVVVNERFHEWYGCPPDAVAGRRSHDIFPAEFADAYVALDLEALESGKAMERELDVPFLDGTLHQVLVTKFPVLGADGRPLGVGSINTDMTDRRRVEEQLRQAQKMEALGQLTGGVAHDFNNLLAVIQGNLDLIDEALEDKAELSELVDDALDSARRGAELTRRLLAFGRRQTLRPEVTNVGDLVLGMVRMLERTLGEEIEIETVLAGGPWKMMVDRSQLEIALLNLAINARDAMPDGGTLKIESATEDFDRAWGDLEDLADPGRYVSLAVGDNGSGMAPDILEQAFDPFFTTKEVGRGSGLGLSMVYGFVKQSGGHVRLRSEVGRGTTVKLYLPAATGDAADAVDVGVPDREPEGRGEAILVVENEPRVRKLTARLLTHLGYRVVASAENGRAALAMLDRAGEVDLLFTDVVLPGGLSGVQLAREARARMPDLKVLFTSGSADNAIVGDATLDVGARLVTKPFRKEDLARTVREALGAVRS
ncbi:MAG: response regulator [Alphaproteobacteria bacterium]